MPFKIVQTIEKGETCLTVVPARWEESGVLFWPKKSVVEKLSLDENSVPEANWERINCVKKRDFTSRAEAERELEKMEAISDTEADEKSAPPPPPVKKARHLQSLNIRDASVVQNFNHLIQHPDNNTQENPTSDDEFLNLPSCPLLETLLVLPEGAGANDESSLVIIPQVSGTTDGGQTNNALDAILVNQNNILENQMRMMQYMATMQTHMEYLTQAVYDNKSSRTPPADQIEILSKPVNSAEELNKLEESLKDEGVLQKFVSNMSFICGTNGKANGVDCCYKPVDYFMTREFLTECSWTGVGYENKRRVGDENKPDNALVVEGTETNNSKVPIKFFKHFRALFLKLVLLADKDFTEIKCEEFFKRVMKNSKQRLGNKVSSKHKNRPNNLQYTTRKDKDISEADGHHDLNQGTSNSNN